MVQRHKSCATKLRKARPGASKMLGILSFGCKSSSTASTPPPPPLPLFHVSNTSRRTSACSNDRQKASDSASCARRRRHRRKRTSYIPNRWTNVRLAICAGLPPWSRRVSLSRPFPESSSGRTFNHFFTVTASLTLCRLRKQRLLGLPSLLRTPERCSYLGLCSVLASWRPHSPARLQEDLCGRRCVVLIQTAPVRPFAHSVCRSQPLD